MISFKHNKLTLSPSSPGRPGIPRSPCESTDTHFKQLVEKRCHKLCTGEKNILNCIWSTMYAYLYTCRSYRPRRSRRTLITERGKQEGIQFDQSTQDIHLSLGSIVSIPTYFMKTTSYILSVDLTIRMKWLANSAGNVNNRRWTMMLNW